MPPSTESTSHIALFFSWVWLNVIQISAILGGIGILVSGVFGLSKRKVEYDRLQVTVQTMDANQKKVIGLIPEDSWNDGVKLINLHDCQRFRVDCRTRILVDNLQESHKTLKEAIGLMITHNKDIPEEEKNQQIQKLMR